MRIVLIDDEVVIVNGIKNMISRLRQNKDEVFAFTDFTELLNFLEKTPCDLLISDICMETCDGFQVIENIKQKGLCANFAIISGFDYFSYAKKSIEMGVVDYLLKPIEEEELLCLIEKTELRIEESLAKKTTEQVKDFIDGHISYQKFIELNNSQVLTYTQKKCCVVKCSDKIKSSILPELKSTFEDVLTFEAIHSVYYIVIAKEIQLEIVKSALKKGTSRFCAVSDVIDFKNLPEAYLQSKRVAEFRPLLTDKGTLFWQDVEHKQTDSFALTKLATAFFVAIREKGSRGAEKSLMKLFDELSTRRNLYFLEDFVARVNEMLKPNERIRFREYSDCQTLANAIIKSVDTGKKTEKTTENILLEGALAYIERNYCKAITLAMVANEISVNYYYLSRLFKEQLRMNFKQYITEKRMARAVELLREPTLKVYDIAQMCGYENVNTFNEAFKSAYSITPTEYRLQF